jgi:sugar/nucleoside kinase (ribokinase family)
MGTGLFVGLVTLDLIYLTPTLPDHNQKVVALDYAIAAGGPATNAAVAFQHLGNSATLLAVVGEHPFSQFAATDLQAQQVRLVDLAPHWAEPLPTSSILVTQATGERAVISINATRSQAMAEQIPASILQRIRSRQIEIILIDGHQMAVGQEIARQASETGTSVVIDGGSWKPGFEKVLPYVDYAICSANFRPPGCHTLADVLAYLQAANIPNIAITQGERPIIYVEQSYVEQDRPTEPSSQGEIPAPRITAVDTVGAGDIFHGAFCHFIRQTNFRAALHQASQVAARACQSFGTRQWMDVGD